MSESITEVILGNRGKNRVPNVEDDDASENNLKDICQTVIVIAMKMFLALGPFVSMIFAAYRLYANNEDICDVTNYPLFATKIFFMLLVGAQLGLIGFVGVKAGVMLKNQQVIFHKLNECSEFYFLVLLCALNVAGNFLEMFRVCGMLMKFVDSVENVISILLLVCVANNNVTRINIHLHFTGWWRVFMASICLYNVGMFFLDTANSKKVDDYLYALSITISVTYRTQIAMFFFNKAMFPANRILGAAEELIELLRTAKNNKKHSSNSDNSTSNATSSSDDNPLPHNFAGYTPPAPQEQPKSRSRIASADSTADSPLLRFAANEV